MTHLGQRLSALIDGELDISERERVLMHLARCQSCRDEAAALRMLKRRMNALGDAAAGAGLTGLTGRLMDLSASAPVDGVWPPPAPPVDLQLPDHGSRSDLRAGRYFLAGSLAVFLAGLGTAAFIAGGDPQAKAPAAPVTPSVDVLMVPRDYMNGVGPDLRDRTSGFRPRTSEGQPRPDSPNSARLP